MRVIVDRINRVVRKRRKVLKKSVYRADVYALAKAIKNGALPFDVNEAYLKYQTAKDTGASRSEIDMLAYGVVSAVGMSVIPF